MRRWSVRSAILVLATVFVAFSCDRNSSPDSPLSPPAAGDLLGLPTLGLGDLTTRDPDEQKQEEPSDQPQSLVFVQEDGPSQQEFTTAVLSLAGGVLGVGGHSVEVPQGAVLEPTLFTMLVPATPEIDVELNAYVPNGISGLLRKLALFRKPVTLELSYAKAPGDIDPDRLVIVRILDGGRYEILPTQVDKGRQVIRAQLDHFSKYAMASN